jgi:hypothetical protein
VLGIVYGAMLANLVPRLLAWWHAPTSFTAHAEPVPLVLRAALACMAAGVFVSGMRDGAAALGMRWARWPWAPWPR